MTADGERAPRIGEQFRNSAILLVKSLGYQETFSGRNGLDFVAKSPSIEGVFRQPCFSPNGKTAFEFTAETRVNIKRESETLNEKIRNYNSSLDPGQPPIAGGVLVVDNKIANSKIANVNEEGIFCWDNRHLSFLTAKCKLWSDWTPNDRRKGSTRAFHEEVIESNITRFKVINAKSGFNDAFIGVFHHSPIAILCVSEVKRFLPAILQPIKEYANREAMDTVLHLQMHVAGEIERGLLYDFIDVLTDNVDDFIRIQEDSCGIHYYSCAPWASFLPQT